MATRKALQKTEGLELVALGGPNAIQKTTLNNWLTLGQVTKIAIRGQYRLLGMIRAYD